MSERTLLNSSPGKVTYLERDASDKAGQHRVMQYYDDHGVLAQNAKIRRSGRMQKNMRKGLMDNQPIEYWMRIPSVNHLQEFTMKNPRVMEDLHSPDESTRMKGARAMSILEPEWIIFAR